jgi:ArsR family transcriptional regulator, cadmium/lead-responsive transcriptional repressor
MALATSPAELKARLFHGFSDPSRLAILDALRAGPTSVGEIVNKTRLSQPNVSNHLACLLDCGLVAREQRGRYVYYQLRDERVAQLLGIAEAVLADAARGLYECSRFQLPERGEDR